MVNGFFCRSEGFYLLPVYNLAFTKNQLVLIRWSWNSALVIVVLETCKLIPNGEQRRHLSILSLVLFPCPSFLYSSYGSIGIPMLASSGTWLNDGSLPCRKASRGSNRVRKPLAGDFDDVGHIIPSILVTSLTVVVVFAASRKHMDVRNRSVQSRVQMGRDERDERKLRRLSV